MTPEQRREAVKEAFLQAREACFKARSVIHKMYGETLSYRGDTNEDVTFTRLVDFGHDAQQKCDMALEGVRSGRFPGCS